MSKRASEKTSKRRHRTCGVSVVVATNAPKAARSARVLLEPVEHMKMRKLKMKEICRVEPGNFARNMMPCASLHSSILENTGEARGGSPPIMEQPVKRAG